MTPPRGLLAPSAIRSMDLDVLVDTGASGLVLPEEIVDALGITIVGTPGVVDADERVGKRRLLK